MSKFFTVREPLVVTVGEQKHTFYIRELPYLQFLEITRKAGEQGATVADLGRGVVEAVVLEAVEEDDGSKSYANAEEWRSEIKAVMEPLSRAAMRVQGIKLDAKPEPLSAEQAEGNA